jgi:hypothetical protein
MSNLYGILFDVIKAICYLALVKIKCTFLSRIFFSGSSVLELNPEPIIDFSDFSNVDFFYRTANVS